MREYQVRICERLGVNSPGLLGIIHQLSGRDKLSQPHRPTCPNDAGPAMPNEVSGFHLVDPDGHELSFARPLLPVSVQ